MSTRISQHAISRYRQRVEPNVDRPRQAIEDDLDEAEEVDTHRVTNAVAMAVDDALYVLDPRREVCQTVLRRYD
jgi:hypothetical protein